MAPRSATKKDLTEEVQDDVSMTEEPTSHQPAEDDESMQDRDDDEEQGDDEEEEEVDDTQKVKLVCDSMHPPRFISFHFIAASTA